MEAEKPKEVKEPEKIKELKPKTPRTKFDDITGNKYNRFTVIELAKHDATKGIYWWRLRCECGKERVLRRSSFVYGGTKSCGCLLREARNESQKARRARTGDFYNERIY